MTQFSTSHSIRISIITRAIIAMLDIHHIYKVDLSSIPNINNINHAWKLLKWTVEIDPILQA